jgi:hypothetical protein
MTSASSADRLELERSLGEDAFIAIGKRSSGSGQVAGAVPGQEVAHPIDVTGGDAGQLVTQPGRGIDAVVLGRSDPAVQGGSALTAPVGAGK